MNPWTAPETQPAGESTLRLYLLGPFYALLGDQRLGGLRSDKARALLAYLATEQGHLQPRAKLAALLWDEFSSQAAMTNLRVTLSNIKRVLNQWQEGICLEITRQDVTFEAQPCGCWVDIAEFEALQAKCRAHAHAKLAGCAECIERLIQATALYRGDFLEGLTLPDSPGFSEWRLLQQEKYHQQTLLILDVLIPYHIQREYYYQAERFARRMLDLEPWRETAHRHLMLIYNKTGRKKSALAQYDHCRDILQRELGVLPDEETRAIYESLGSNTV
ncbi:MAG: AfsR/SARP family transcriptional regulator [Chloroflexota bacterium]